MDAIYLVGVTQVREGKNSCQMKSYFPRAAFKNLDDAYDYFLRVEKEVWSNGCEAYLVSMCLGEEPNLSVQGFDNFDLFEGRIFET